MIADRDIWATADLNKIVEATDPRRAYLIARKGAVVPSYVAVKYGLAQEKTSRDDSELEAKPEPQARCSEQPEAEKRQEYVNDKRRGRKKWR